MTPFIAVCSYVAMLSLAILVLLIFLFRYYRYMGKDNSHIGFFIMVCGALFIIGTILIGIFYRP